MFNTSKNSANCIMSRKQNQSIDVKNVQISIKTLKRKKGDKD